MKTAHLAGFGFGCTADNASRPPTRGGDTKSRAVSPRVFIEFETARNLVAGSNLGSGDVLVYGTAEDQDETSH